MIAATLDAQLFGEESPPHGRSVRVEMRSRALVLHDPAGREEEVPYARLQSRGGGWRGDALLLEWDGERGRRSLSLHRPEALATLRAQAPEALRAVLGRQARAPRRKLRHGVFAIGGATIAIVAAGLVLAIVRAERLVEFAASRVPLAWEERLGDLVAAQVTSTGAVRSEGEPARALREIGDRLAAQTGSLYRFRWYLVDDGQVNAFAAPGGSVIVYSGLMRTADSPEELAGVLAHEIQHVVCRHSLQGLVRGLGWRAAIGLALGGGGDLGTMAGGIVEKLGALRFSRQQETEADVEGARLLQKAGIEAAGMARFFERVAAEGTELPAFLATHPASADRARRIRALIDPNRRGPPLPYDWERVRAELASPAVPAPAR